MAIKLNSSKNNRVLDKKLINELKTNSALLTTKEFLGHLGGKSEWSAAEIDKRTKKLAKWSLKRWTN